MFRVMSLNVLYEEQSKKIDDLSIKNILNISQIVSLSILKNFVLIKKV